MATETLGVWLAKMSEERRARWAGDRTTVIDDEIAMALHIAGWKIVSQDDPNHLWPFDTIESGCQCPPWRKDVARKGFGR